MFTQEITAETPIIQMTAGQLAAYLSDHKESKADGSRAEGTAQPRRYVYGIKGIMRLFGVSNVTAQRYKRGIIKEAVSHQGRIIVVDEEKALQLFRQHKQEE